MVAVKSNQQKIWVEDEGVAKQVVYEELLNARFKPKDVPTMTMEDVAASREDPSKLLIVIKGRVYNMIRFVKHHPGGLGPLYHGAGKDMTDPFVQFHSLETYKRLNAYHVANVADKDIRARNSEPLQKDWDELTQQLLAEGMYQTNYWYFVRQAVRALCFLAASLLFTFGYFGHSTSMHVVGAALMGMWFQQTAFVGHDTGHNGITHNRKWDDIIGLVFGNTCGGLGIGWWKKSHNNHHICCNSIDNDADIQHLPFLACNPKIVDKPFWSSYHDKIFNATDALTRFILSYQHIFYYPIILCFSRYNLYVQTWLHIIWGRSKMPGLEIITLCAFFGWFGAIVNTMPTGWEMFLYVFVSHSVAGLLNLQITLSHFCTEVYYGSTYNHANGISDGWLHTQLKTTIAIDNHRMMDWFHGGLQFQDIHHLFPRVPRHNLRAIRPRIRALLKKHKLALSPRVSFFEGNVMVMKLLIETARKVSKMSYIPATDIVKSPLWETLNAQG